MWCTANVNLRINSVRTYTHLLHYFCIIIIFSTCLPLSAWFNLPASNLHKYKYLCTKYSYTRVRICARVCVCIRMYGCMCRVQWYVRIAYSSLALFLILSVCFYTCPLLYSNCSEAYMCIYRYIVLFIAVGTRGARTSRQREKERQEKRQHIEWIENKKNRNSIRMRIRSRKTILRTHREDEDKSIFCIMYTCDVRGACECDYWIASVMWIVNDATQVVDTNTFKQFKRWHFRFAVSFAPCFVSILISLSISS